MAEKRMFARTIVCSDAFLELPPAAQALYFQIGMLADDDGVCGQVQAAMNQAHAKAGDMQALLDGRFILDVDGVAVVKHWHINNHIRKDRYHPTTYDTELAKLVLKDNGAYSLKPERAV